MRTRGLGLFHRSLFRVVDVAKCIVAACAEQEMMFAFAAHPGIDPQPAENELLPESVTAAAPDDTGAAQRARKLRQGAGFDTGLGCYFDMSVRVQGLSPMTRIKCCTPLPVRHRPGQA